MKKYLAIVLAMALPLGLAACGSSPAGTRPHSPVGSGAVVSSAKDSADAAETASSDSDDTHISVILKTTTSEFWGYVVAGAEGYAQEHPNVYVDIKGASSETAYSEQLGLIEADLENEEYDGYVIAPLQAGMAASRIMGETRPVVALDTDINAHEVVSFVGIRNEDAGRLGGETAAKLAKERGWTDIYCIEIAGVQGDSTNDARMAGYKAGVEAAGGVFLDHEVQYANAEAENAASCMEAIIQNHPEGIAVICANNDDMAMAAARVAAGHAAYRNTVFLGFDGIQSACHSILAGEETISVSQPAYDMGYQAVDAVVRAIEGETVEPFIDVGAAIVDHNNANERLKELQGYLT